MAELEIKILRGPDQEPLFELMSALGANGSAYWQESKYPGSQPFELHMPSMFQVWMTDSIVGMVMYDGLTPVGFGIVMVSNNLWCKDVVAITGPFYIRNEYRNPKNVMRAARMLYRYVKNHTEADFLMIEREISKNPHVCKRKLVYSRKKEDD